MPERAPLHPVLAAQLPPSWGSVESQLAHIAAGHQSDLVLVCPRQAAVLLDLIRHGAMRLEGGARG